jgi:nitrite reductase/ring-hydroxylating ferredoxin subunit
MCERLPSPFGWFAIGVSSDYTPGQAVPAKWFDQDLVVFRSEDGTLAALDAYCPHLGAHLGYGGTVSEGSITCPFHGYRWAADGTCLSVPYGNRVAPGIRIPTVPVVEQDGIVLLWRGSGNQPTWHMPRLFDGQRWTAPQVTRRTIRSHPQEIMENGVDFAHFLFIHQTHMVELTTNVKVDGHVFEFTCQSAPDAVEPDLRLPDGVPLEGRIFLHGPGFGGNMMMPKEMPIQALQRVYATPVGDDEVSLIIMVNIRIDEGCDEPTADALMPTLSSEVFDQLDRDVVIWEHKRHLRRPALNPKERAISTFRRWYAQYYDDPGLAAPTGVPVAQSAPA